MMKSLTKQTLKITGYSVAVIFLFIIFYGSQLESDFPLLLVSAAFGSLMSGIVVFILVRSLLKETHLQWWQWPFHIMGSVIGALIPFWIRLPLDHARKKWGNTSIWTKDLDIREVLMFAATLVLVLWALSYIR